VATDEMHPTRTQRSQHEYMFTAKHHGGGSRSDACWSPQVTRDGEFSVFDLADLHSIADDGGWLYGVLRDSNHGLRDLGTWGQQIAEFPKANEGVPWHGFPIWAVNNEAPPNRAAETLRPSKEVFQQMEKVGLITRRERKRLYKGDHA